MHKNLTNGLLAFLHGHFGHPEQQMHLSIDPFDVPEWCLVEVLFSLCAG
jgi:hypothetical protein